MGSRGLGALLLAAWVLPAGALESSPAGASLKASGYLKELWQHSRSAFEERPYFLNTARARLSLEGSLPLGSFSLKAQADYDQEVLAGSFFRTREYGLFGLAEAPAWLEMEHAISRGETSLWRQRLYRGWAGLEGESFLLRLGRQRIAWGTGKLWNPTDVLNPYQPISIEREERRGVDALSLRAELGSLRQAELAYAPQELWPQSALLARLKSNWRDYDFSLLGGKVAPSTGSWLAGGDFAGNLWEGTLHGEWSYTDPKTRTPYWKADLGFDYSFSPDSKLAFLRDAAVVLEYLRSGAGALDQARYDLGALFSGREVTLAQDYLGLSYSKDLHPLVKLELVAIANLNDESHFLGPGLQWNALNNLYLTAGLQRFGGGRTSEFGRTPNLAFLMAQYFF